MSRMVKLSIGWMVIVHTGLVILGFLKTWVPAGCVAGVYALLATLWAVVELVDYAVEKTQRT